MSWPPEIQETSLACSADGARQRALFSAPRSRQPSPAVLSLHPWSGDYRDELDAPLARACIERDWGFVHPDFRGPNNRREAMGSRLVLSDIADAARFIRSMDGVDATKVAVVGLSGGGYTALLAAAWMPSSWVGVSAWVPIADLAAWYQETLGLFPRYAREIAQACGGPPGSSREADEQYRARSPLGHLKQARRLRVDINAGIHDGHGEGSVPVSHALRAFNALARRRDRLTEAQITYVAERAIVPAGLGTPVEDPSYEGRRLCFRRESGRARVTLFEGGHEMILGAATSWLGLVFASTYTQTGTIGGAASPTYR